MIYTNIKLFLGHVKQNKNKSYDPMQDHGQFDRM